MSSPLARELRVQSSSAEADKLASSPLSSPLGNQNSSILFSSPTIPRQRYTFIRSPSRQNRRLYRPTARLSSRQRFVATLQLWKGQRWGIKAFLKQWVDAEMGSFAKTRRIRLLQESLEQLEVRTALATVSTDNGNNDDLSIETLLKEFNALIGKDFLNKYDHTASIEKLDYALAFKVIESNAPTWTALLTRLMSNQRHHWNSYGASKNLQQNQQQIYLITAILCRCRARKTANFLAKTMGIYLHGSGVKRRVIEVLAGLGICDSYQLVNQIITNIAEDAKNKLKSLATDPHALIVYDNFNFKDNVRDQVLGSSRSTMRNMTTALLVHCPEFPITGLKQSMFDASHSLNLDDILTAQRLRRDGIARQISTYFIATAVRTLHPEAVDFIFHSKDVQFPQMSRLELLTPRRTTIQQLGAIYHDEGTIEGTYGVHHDIWIRQLGLKEDDESHHFDERLWLAWGDQKTASFIRNLKVEQSTSTRAFDRRDWLLGPNAFFHVLQALLYLIVRTHFDSPPGTHSKSTLLHDIGYWDRHGITRENVKYHLLEPLVMQGWTSRVLAIWYDVLHSNNCFQDIRGVNKDRHETYSNAIKKLSTDQFLQYVEEVRQQAFTKNAWSGRQQADKEFVTMCRYLQEVEAFMTLRYAINHGDIGLIRRLIDPLCVWFYGAEQAKYGLEMLHLRWLLSNEVTSNELQRSILSSSLVNLAGRPDSFKAIDLALEHVNCCYAVDIKLHKNSTHDVGKIFGRLALASSYITCLRSAVETHFGEKSNYKHSQKSALADIFSLAYHIWAEGCTQPKTIKEGQMLFESLDVLDDGMELLEEKIQAFNALPVVTNDPVPNIFNKETDNTESYSTADYINAVDNDFYNDIDPVLCISTV